MYFDKYKDVTYNGIFLSEVCEIQDIKIFSTRGPPLTLRRTESQLENTVTSSGEKGVHSLAMCTTGPEPNPFRVFRGRWDINA
mgnify:CR=1 FL=1